ncbi:HDOD domain-containing protein [Noviherbaspirillum malthae]|jgi:HD-like signal output (HDOD) protein|uniref:HDOD domain-containing protein n=1 Tax=Noviherbaspirillum malthae TaxID=1260987 RepID=UPI0018900374|nr:HDOD domain-containing protein [Noviherbaspirillum malthae]
MKNWLNRLLGREPGLSRAPANEDASPPATLDTATTMLARSATDIDGLFHPWLLGVDAAAGLRPNETEVRLARALGRIAGGTGQPVSGLVPRMPAVIPMLLQSLRDKDVSNAQLSQQIVQDPVLLAAVLRQVNTSHYRRRAAIASIEQALALLGQNGLRLLVASVAFKPMLGQQSGHFTRTVAPRLVELSSHTALACRCLAARLGADAFEVFLAGLLQNVGMMVALRAMDQVHDGKEHLQSGKFCAVFADNARRLSVRVGREWAFPPQVVEAAGQAGLAAAAPSTLAQAVRQADLLGKTRTLAHGGGIGMDEAECLIAELGADGLACWQELAERDADAGGPESA